MRWLVLLCLLPSFGLFAQTTVTVGTGTTSTTNVPITAFYDYSYAQMIYEGSELVAAGAVAPGVITKLSFNVATTISAANVSKVNNWTVYIANTTKTTFTANHSQFESEANMQQVFSGLVVYPSSPGWVEVVFSTPFNWTGGNILVAIDNNSNDYINSSSPSWNSSSLGTNNNKVLYVFRDDTDILPSSIPSQTTPTANISTTRPNIRFLFSNPCTGTPNAGTISSNPSNIIAGSTFTLNATGFTEDLNMSYQWQELVGGAWTDIGAPTSGYSALSSVNAPALGVTKEYRLKVVCNNSSQESYSNTLSITSNYCIPTATGANYSKTITTTGGVSNLSYSASSFSGYVDNTSTIFSANAGSTLNFSIIPSANTAYYYNIWVDWDNDGDFTTPGDKIVGTTATAYYYNGGYLIPGNIPSGNYRVRIGLTTTSNIAPCASITNGNFVDFTLNVISAPVCTGAPIAGAVTVTPNQGVAGSTYSVTAAGYSSNFSGLSYLWQSRLNNGTWTNVGAVSNTYAPLTGLTAPAMGSFYDYRLVVICDATNDSTFSVEQRFTTGYCTPVSTSNYYINNFSTTGGVNNISNLNSGKSPNGYGDFTSQILSQYVNSSVNFTADFVGGTFGMAIVIDWNNNGVFESTEKVYFPTSMSASLSGSFAIPAGTTPGNYRMRVLADFNIANPTNFCGFNSSNGEAEDYILTVLAIPTCELPLNGGVAIANPVEDAPGATYVVNASGFSQGSTMEYQWQVSVNLGPWTNVGASTNSYASLNNRTAQVIGTQEDYRLIVKCLASGDSVFSSTATFVSGYCKPAFGGTNYLSSVRTLNGITNLNYNASSYVGYANQSATASFSQYPGLPINFILTPNSGQGVYTVWIDWDQNGNFTDVGDTAIRTTAQAYIYNNNFIIPANTLPGQYRVRVGYVNGTTQISSCGNNGSFVDFTLDVLSLPSCSGIPNTGTISLSPSSGVVGSTFTVSSTGFSFGNDMQYQWQSNTNGAGWVNEGPVSLSYVNLQNQIAPNYGITKEYRLMVVCDNGPDTVYSNVVSFNTTYCTPVSGTTNQYYISSITSTGAVSDLLYSANSYTSYVNNTTSPSFSVHAGSSIPLTMLHSSLTGYFYAWVDWNQNGTFGDAGENIFVSPSTSASYTNNITIHSGQAPGIYRIRFAINSTSTLNPCSSAVNGNYVDLTFEILPGASCTSTPNAGIVTVTPASGVLGATYNVTANGFSNASGLSFQWQSNTNNGGWVNEGAPSSTYVPLNGLVFDSIGTSIDYRLLVICVSSADTAISNIENALSRHCLPTGSSGAYLSMMNTSGAVNNITYSASAYNTYTDNSAQLISQLPGNTIVVNMFQSSSTAYFYCWVDWNNDGDFTDAGENVFTSGLVGLYNGLINIASNRPAGLYKVRFATSTSSTLLPCGSASVANFIDYTLEVLPPPACVMPINAGTITVSPSSASAGASYSVAATGFTIATGLLFQWQSNTNNGGWVNVGAATNLYAPLNNLVVPSYGTTIEYRLKLVCVAADDSVFSNVDQIISTYCTPATNSNTTYYINNITSSNGVGTNITYTANSYTAYVNLSSSVIVSQYPGQSLNLSMSVSSSTSNFFCWVDWNNDGDFSDAGEFVFNTTPLLSSASGSIPVPAGQAAGQYRVRIAHSYTSSTANLPCGSYGNSNFVDFTLEVISAPLCNATPVGGIVTAPVTVVSGGTFNVSASGYSVETGLNFQWQSNINGGGWNNVGAATSVYAPLNNQTAPAFGSTIEHRLIVTCTALALSDTSTIASTVVDYCTPSSTSNTYYINSFVTTNGIANINNASSGYSPNGQGNFTTLVASQVAGSSISFTANITGGSRSLAIWVDWNQDGVFANNEVVFSSTTNASNHSGTFMIPTGLVAGNYRMRVMMNNSSTTTTPCAFGLTSGEYEDYTLNVLTAVGCSITPLPSNVTAIANIPSVCVSENVVLSLATPITALDLTYQWEVSNDGGSAWNSSSSVLSGYVDTVLVNTAVDFRLNVLCNGSHWLYSSPVTINVNNPQILSVLDSTRCGYGTVTLNATSNVGSTINWYANATGGSVLLTGANFVTPNLNNTTTYYVSASNGIPVQQWLGTGTATSTSQGAPYYTNYKGVKNQYLIRAAELQALGYTAGYFSAIAFDVVGATGLPLTNYTIKMGMTNLATLTTSFVGGLTQVYTTPSYVPVANTANTHQFQNSFYWDGVSNVVVETCMLNTSYATGHYTKYSTVSYNASLYSNSDTDLSICSSSTGTTSTSRPNIRFTQTGCESPRQAVTATVTTPVAINATVAAATICKGTSTTGSATSANPGYTYTWLPINQVGASVTLNPTITTQYIVWAQDQTTGPNAGCVTSDTVQVSVDSIAAPLVHANPLEVCSGEEVYLSTGSTYTLGTGTLTSTTVESNPFRITFGGRKSQYLINASELTALGLGVGSVINNIGIIVTSASATQTFGDLTISAGFVAPIASLTTTFVPTGLTTVYNNANYIASVGNNIFHFTSGLVWDGVSDLVLQFCWSNNNAAGTTTPSVRYATTTVAKATYYQVNNAGVGAVCGTITGTATVASRPVFLIGASVTSNVTYNWTPIGAQAANVVDRPVNNGTAINTIPYTLTVTNVNGCSASATVNVDVKPAPVATITSMHSFICSDNTQGFYIDGASSVNPGSYNWNNGLSTDPSLLVTQAGTYYLEVSNSFNCSDVDTFVVVGVTPVTPIITIDHITSTEATLNAGSSYSSYLWNTLQNSQIINVTEPGTYTVTVTDSNGCTAVSDPLTINKISIDEKEQELSFSVFPNPSNGIFNVRFENFIANEMTIKLIDATGRILHLQQLNNMPASFTHSVDVSSIADGNYFIRVETMFGVETRQIIVIK